MSMMMSMEYTHDKELENMLKEIQNSLSTHLANILTPIFNEKKDIHNILLNVPMIKKMHVENIELKSINKLLSDEIHKLKEELSKYQNIRLQVKELNNPEEKLLNIALDTARKNTKMEVDSNGISFQIWYPTKSPTRMMINLTYFWGLTIKVWIGHKRQL